jgi:hypothetical protein
MKKLILVFAVVAMTVGAYAQTDTTNSNINTPDISKTDDGLNQNMDMQDNQTHVQNIPVKSHPDGVTMQDGKMMKVKKGEMTVLDADITMSNGTKITKDGTCIDKDGTKMTMKEGQHIDMSGNATPLKLRKDKDLYLVPDSTHSE